MAEPLAGLRSLTPSRVALGRSGDGLPTGAHLDFQLAHALARDAVHGEVDFDLLSAELQPLETVCVHSAAIDRATYLRRPDLGRVLAAREELLPAPCDVVFVIGDGLSAAAVQRHAAPMLKAALGLLEGLTIGSVVFARQARVAIGDDIGERMGAKMVAVLIGERPGLSVADSLGIYLTYDPRVGRKDAERNCISNIHGEGLTCEQAAENLVWLVREGLRRKLTGVGLKAGVSDPRGLRVREPGAD